MKYSEFEKQVRTKLGSQEIDLDTAAFYKQLNQGRNKRRPGALIIYLPLALIVGIAITYFAFKPIEVSEGGKLTFSTEKTSVATMSEGKVYQTSLTDNTVANSSNENTINNQVAQNSDKENTKINTISSVQKSNNQNSSFSTLNNENNKHKSASSSIAVTSNTNDNMLSSEAIQVGNSKKVIKNNNAFGNEKTKEVIAAEEINFENSNTAVNQLNLLVEEIESRDLTLLNQLNHLTFNNLPLPKEQLNLTKIECPDFRVNKKWFDIELLAEIGYFRPIKKLTPIGNSPNEVDQLRSANEASKEGYHAGIYAKFTGRRIPLYIQAGVSQDFLTEKMDLSYSYIERDTTQGIISITKSESGDTITAIIGDIINETEVTGNKKKHYRLQMIDIPITLGYAFNFNRFSLGIEGGVLFNIGMVSRGSILTDLTDFENVETQTPFKRNVGISYLGGISLGYHLTPRSKLYLNAKLRVIPGAINAVTNSLNQKYNFAGVNVGYGYLF